MDTNKSRAKAKAAKKGAVKKEPEVIDFNLEMMKNRLRQEIIDKAKHLDIITQEDVAMYVVDMNKHLDRRSIISKKEDELNNLKKVASESFGIVFPKPERYEQYLH